MVVAASSSVVKGKLVTVDGKMEGVKHKTILIEKLLLAAKDERLKTIKSIVRLGNCCSTFSLSLTYFAKQNGQKCQTVHWKKENISYLRLNTGILLCKYSIILFYYKLEMLLQYRYSVLMEANQRLCLQKNLHRRSRSQSEKSIIILFKFLFFFKTTWSFDFKIIHSFLLFHWLNSQWKTLRFVVVTFKKCKTFKRYDYICKALCQSWHSLWSKNVSVPIKVIPYPENTLKKLKAYTLMFLFGFFILARQKRDL